ncbi:hypothetical protein PENSPDRAFT_283038 [Peniophora sp. CONT]|nr:hypothetical protein PENSPDRAFT_283038 [Peniophora sp. CONT]
MKMLDVFCSHLKQTQRAMTQQDLYKDIISACERQTAKGDAENEWDVYARAAAPLEAIIDQKRIFYHLITEHGFVKFMARAAVLAARFAGQEDAEPIDGWEALFHRLGQLPNDGDKLDGSAYRDFLRRLLQPVHAPTLAQIKKLRPSPGQRRALKMWASFGEGVFGFVGEIRSKKDLAEHRKKEAAEEAKNTAQLKPFCSLTDCYYHTVEPPHALSKCSGCATVQYCNGACQMKDWKAGHKAACKELKAQQAAKSA